MFFLYELGSQLFVRQHTRQLGHHVLQSVQFGFQRRYAGGLQFRGFRDSELVRAPRNSRVGRPFGRGLDVEEIESAVTFDAAQC